MKAASGASSQCTNCAVGRYTEKNGAEECNICPTAKTEGATTCVSHAIVKTYSMSHSAYPPFYFNRLGAHLANLKIVQTMITVTLALKATIITFVEIRNVLSAS